MVGLAVVLFRVTAAKLCGHTVVRTLVPAAMTTGPHAHAVKAASAAVTNLCLRPLATAATLPGEVGVGDERHDDYENHNEGAGR